MGPCTREYDALHILYSSIVDEPKSEMSDFRRGDTGLPVETWRRKSRRNRGEIEEKSRRNKEMRRNRTRACVDDCQNSVNISQH